MYRKTRGLERTGPAAGHCRHHLRCGAEVSPGLGRTTRSESILKRWRATVPRRAGAVFRIRCVPGSDGFFGAIAELSIVAALGHAFDKVDPLRFTIGRPQVGK
jgi:hypothetical protein